MNCPECDKPMVACEYDYRLRGDYDYDDDFPEFQCAEGHPVIRIGRWTTDRRLDADEIEKRFGGKS